MRDVGRAANQLPQCGREGLAGRLGAARCRQDSPPPRSIGLSSYRAAALCDEHTYRRREHHGGNDDQRTSSERNETKFQTESEQNKRRDQDRDQRET